MTNAILRGKPDAGNPHVRFDEGEVASAKPRRGSLLYKKTLIALSFVCAGALAFADNPQYNDSWFSGINNATAIDALNATNGKWSGLTVDNAEVKDGALVLDLDVTDEGVAEEATFTVLDTAKDEAKDAFPVQRVVVSGVFTPIAAEDLLAGTAMAAKEAKVGFAIVNVGSETDSYKYYAWVGKESTAEDAAAIADWEDLGEATDVSTAKTIVIDLDYSTAGAVTATFTVGETKAMKALEGEALKTALADKVIASVSCTGSGTLSALQGKYQYAVAEVDGVKYATVDAAVKAAATSKNGTVTVVRDLKAGDTVAAANGVTIKAGTGVTPLSKDKVTLSDTSDTSKEVVEANGVVTVQTKKNILDEVKVGTASKSLTAGSQEADEKVAKFRDFLNKHCGTAYRKANTTPADIKKALDAEKSGRTLWQSYALGVEPDATLKLAQVESDTDPEGITLALPSVVSSGDFTISYTVTDDTEAGTKTVTDARTVKVPLKTGHYKVKISFE